MGRCNFKEVTHEGNSIFKSYTFFDCFGQMQIRRKPYPQSLAQRSKYRDFFPRFSRVWTVRLENFYFKDYKWRPAMVHLRGLCELPVRWLDSWTLSFSLYLYSCNCYSVTVGPRRLPMSHHNSGRRMYRFSHVKYTYPRRKETCVWLMYRALNHVTELMWLNVAFNFLCLLFLVSSWCRRCTGTEGHLLILHLQSGSWRVLISCSNAFIFMVLVLSFKELIINMSSCARMTYHWDFKPFQLVLNWLQCGNASSHHEHGLFHTSPHDFVLSYSIATWRQRTVSNNWISSSWTGCLLQYSM